MKNYNFKNYAKKHIGLSDSVVTSVMKHQSNSFTLPTNSVGTPMILEERDMRVTQMSVFDRLMMDRIIWISGPVEERMASVIQAQLMFLDNLDSTKDISMHIDTPGGGVCAGLGIRDVMNNIKCDVATTNTGMCASMGSILLSSGTKGKRTSLIHSKVMTHHVSSGTSGVIDDQRITIRESEKYNYLLFKILSENTGLSFKDIHDISKRDKWFNSDEAKKYNLIDDIIGVDKNHQSITELMEGFDEYLKEYDPNNM